MIMICTKAYWNMSNKYRYVPLTKNKKNVFIPLLLGGFELPLHHLTDMMMMPGK
jgi:hypothetical protein